MSRGVEQIGFTRLDVKTLTVREEEYMSWKGVLDKKIIAYAKVGKGKNIAKALYMRELAKKLALRDYEGFGAFVEQATYLTKSEHILDEDYHRLFDNFYELCDKNDIELTLEGGEEC